MNITAQQRQVILRCKRSVVWFLRNFGRIKHPSAGIVPFEPFSYQRKALHAFRKNRLNIFRKCRQSGISKISGAFAPWFAMFHSHKTILIVSRREDDAIGFLRDHIKFLFEHLPKWMQDLWDPKALKYNEHEIQFPNGSIIKSLTSHPDVLRSNASSLNIIDESAFIQHMDVMWAGGWPTLQHGGNVIVISTTNGIGNWYWSTMTDAEAGVNGFNPIVVHWYDMDWVIEYTDPLSLERRRIAPRDGIRECQSKEELEKFGQYWSPWLQEQYDNLQEQGEGWKFEQEVLASYVGSGNTVIGKGPLSYIQTTLKEPRKIKGNQTYVHPTTNEIEELQFDFSTPDEGLWIWEEPVEGTPSKKQGNEVIEHGQPAHSYVMGVDIATGKGRDYSAIEIFDVDTMEQVAEFMARCLPREFTKYVDRIGRWYNCALAVIERNNGGDIIIDALRFDMMYPRIWRKKDINDKPTQSNRPKRQRLKVATYGFATSDASKPTLNKCMIDSFRDDGTGYTIYSTRLLKQLQTYVRKRDRAGRDTGKTEAEDGAGNYDDLVIAAGLALIGTRDAFLLDSSNLVPTGGTGDFKSQSGPLIVSDERAAEMQAEWAEKGGPALLMPLSLSAEDTPETSAQRLLDEYTIQLGGIPVSQNKPAVVPPKFFYEREE